MRLRVPFAMIALTLICGLAMAPSAAPANEGRRAAGVMLPEAEETLEPLEFPNAPAARHSQRPSASIGRGAPMLDPTMDPAGLARAKRRARWSPDAPVAEEVAAEPAAEAAPVEEPAPSKGAEPGGKLDLSILNGIQDRVARGKAKSILNKTLRQGGSARAAAAEIKATLADLGKLDSETEAVLAQLEA